MKRKSDFNLRARGLILTLVPLAIQIAFVLWLCNQLWVLQRQTSEVALLKEIASQTHVLALQTATGVYIMQENTKPHRQIDTENVANQSAELTRMANRIVYLTKDNPKMAKAARKLKQSLQDLLTTLQSAYFVQNRQDMYWKYASKGFWAQMSDRGLDFYAATSAMLDELPSDRLDSTSIMQSSAQTIATAFLVLIGLNLLMAGCLSYWYIKQIRAPLRKIRDDSIHLSAREPLSQASTKSDELGDLDRFLHQVNSSINEAVDKEKQLFENAIDLVCAIDERGQLLRANARSKAILGLESAEITGHSIFEFCKEESDKADQALLATTETATSTTELELTRFDGSRCDTRWSFVRQPGTNEIFCIVHDNSEEKRIEEMKQDFFDMISHDLRGPLTSMLHSVVEINHGDLGPVEENVTVELSHIRKNIERLVEFVNDLLDFEKIKAGKLQLELSEFDLIQVAKEAEATVDSLASAKNIRILIDGAQANCTGDQSKLTQVILNFLTNAIKFSPKDSTIRIVVSKQDHNIEVAVHDRGPGVPVSYTQKIFEPFEQVPGDTKQGSGLGLAICKMLIEAHGGSLGVRSAAEVKEEETEAPNVSNDQTTDLRDEVTHGSIFWFTIPVSHATTAS